MSVGVRLLWIVLIAIGAAFSAGMYLAGLESLSRMIEQLGADVASLTGTWRHAGNPRVAERKSHAQTHR